VIGGLLWLKDSKQDAKALDQRKTEIESFTGDTQSLLQKISPDATEMVGARPDAKALEKDVDRWAKTFSDAQKDLTGTIATAPKDVEIANRLIFQAVLQYAAAAETFKLIPDAPEKLQTKILERATAQVVSADGSWSTGVEALNAARAEVGLEAIALRAPSAATDPAGGTTVPTGG
jgi:hypothetical protein